MKKTQVPPLPNTPLRQAVELMRRLKHLHERSALLGMGRVNDAGRTIRGDRKEEGMGREAYRRIVAKQFNLSTKEESA